MTILLSHTSALEALRRLGCIRQEPIGADAVALDCAPDALRAAALWESALPGTPQAPSTCRFRRVPRAREEAPW